jgi:hypothetical protein
MKYGILLALMVLSAALFPGCAQAPEGQTVLDTSASQNYDDPRAADMALDDAVSPMIAENDTVEIGEML